MEDNYENINIFESNEDFENNSINSENEDSLDENSENMFDNQNQIIIKYKKENYNIILMKSNILKKYVNCPNNIMSLTENINYKYGYAWQCVKKSNNKHDNKINIRNNSIYLRM